MNDLRPAQSSRFPAIRRIAVLAGLLAVLAITLAESGATIWQRRQVTQADDWRQIAARLRSERNPVSEPLLFAPSWVDPLARFHLGDQLTVAQASLSDIDRFSRVWQVSIRGAVHPWLASHPPLQTWTHGKVTLSLHLQQPVNVLYDFYQQIDAATVTIAGNRPCPRRGQRFVCNKRQPWNWVGPYLAEVDHRPYQCIYAHPVADHDLVITWSRVPLGRTLVLYTGIDDFENRKRATAPVRVQISTDDLSLFDQHHQNAWPWQRHDVDTSALAGTARPLEIRISAADVTARAFCFRAEVRQ